MVISLVAVHLKKRRFRRVRLSDIEELIIFTDQHASRKVMVKDIMARITLDVDTVLVSDGSADVKVEMGKAGERKYLRSKADKFGRDSLLSLPRF